MAAYTFLYHMNGGCALETDPFWGNIHVQETLLKYRFEEHSSCLSASCFKKDCECRFLFPFMSTLVHSFTRIKETTIRTKHCGTPWMDQSTVCTPFLFSPKDLWAISSSMLTINQSLKFSISTPTYKLEIHHRFSTALCIQVS